VLGLVDAVTKFDASKRVRLETHARHRIRGCILDGLRGADSAPRDLRRKNLAQWHCELNEIQSAGLDCGRRALSAGPIAVQTSVEPACLAGDDPDPFDLCFRHEQRAILNRALSRLPERERQIITLHYCQQRLPMKQIAEFMRVHESRISQLHSGALVRLKAIVDSLLHPGQAETSVTGTLSMAAGGGT
jgi:RNA polymerase sigma factor for flagellar operon FliA